MEFILNYLITTLPEIFLTVLLGATLFGYSLKKNGLRIFYMATIVALISDLTWLYGVSADLRITISVAVMIITYKVFLKDKWSTSLFMSIAAVISLLIMEILVVSIFLQFFTYEQILNNFGVKFLVIALYTLPLLPIILLLQKKGWTIQSFFKKKVNNIRTTYLWISIIFLVIFQVYMLIYLNYSFFINSHFLSERIIFNINGLPLYSLGILLVNILLVVTIIKLKNYYAKIEIHRAEANYIENLENLLSKLKMERHDFVNEIQTIHGFTQAKMYKHLEEYMSELVQHVRAVNRVIKIKNVPVSAFLHTKIEQMEKDNIELRILTKTDDNFSQIKGYDLVKIISNLLDNAHRAILEGKKDSAYIEINWSKTEKMAVIEISNNGPKITKKVIDKIFKEGYTTKQDKENNGFGLAIVKSTVQKYKGVIEVESTEDRTRFVVKIPL